MAKLTIEDLLAKKDRRQDDAKTSIWTAWAGSWKSGAFR